MEVDTFWLVPGDAGPAVERFAEAVRRRHWPGLVFTVEPFGPEEPALSPTAAGMIAFVRDPEMDERWEEEGYHVGDDGEGPFLVLYGRLPVTELTVDVTGMDSGDPGLMERYGGPTRLWSPTWSSVTLVSGSEIEESPFFTAIVHLLRTELTATPPSPAI